MRKDSKKKSFNRIKSVMENEHIKPVPKAELWLGTDFLEAAGFKDTVENHFYLAHRLNQDMVCLPIAENMEHKPKLGYRYFQWTDLKQAVGFDDRFVAAVIDGPFQELCNRLGLITVLTGWVKDRNGILDAYEKEKDRVLDLICQCLDQGVHAIVITDDLAGDQGSLISPDDIDGLCSSFYLKAAGLIHSAESVVFFHSCGKLTGFTRVLRKWKMDGLAAVQHRANNLLDLQQCLEPGGVIMAGIDAEMLYTDAPSKAVLSDFKILLESFNSKGQGFILSSSCGLYDGKFLDRILNIYRIADQI